MEVVYDPRRHDIILLRGRTTPELQAQMTAAGWSEQASDGASQFWVRERVVQAHCPLRQSADRPRSARIA